VNPHDYCARKAAASGSSFYYSFRLLPPPRRRERVEELLRLVGLEPRFARCLSPRPRTLARRRGRGRLTSVSSPKSC